LALCALAWVVNPLSNGHYDRLKGKVPAAARDKGSDDATPSSRAADPVRTRALRPRCDYYSLSVLHYILWRSAREVKSERKVLAVV
jgi:hypothetical protein